MTSKKSNFIHYTQFGTADTLCVGVVYKFFVAHVLWLNTAGILQVVFALENDDEQVRYLLEDFPIGSDRYASLLRCAYADEANNKCVIAVDPEDLLRFCGTCKLIMTDSHLAIDLDSISVDSTPCSFLWQEQAESLGFFDTKMLPIEKAPPSITLRKPDNFYLQPSQPCLKTNVIYRFGAKKAALLDSGLLQVVFELKEHNKRHFLLEEIPVGSPEFDELIQHLYPVDIDCDHVLEFNALDLVNNFYGTCKLKRRNGRLHIDFSSMFAEVAAFSCINAEQAEEGGDA